MLARRDFLQASTLGVGGLALAHLLESDGLLAAGSHDPLGPGGG